jgi:hypothetical protein
MYGRDSPVKNPDGWPILKSFLVDDNHRFWNELIMENMEAREWIVVSE